MMYPESPAVWPSRRRLLTTRSLEELHRELKWITLVLKAHKKSGDSWEYRQLVLSGISAGASKDAIHDTSFPKSASPLSSPALSQSLLEYELSFIEWQATRQNHHYYAWNHFGFLFNRFPTELLNKADMVNSFFDRMLAATPQHYGAYHWFLKWMKQSTSFKIGGLKQPILFRTVISRVTAIVPVAFRECEAFNQFVYVAFKSSDSVGSLSVEDAMAELVEDETFAQLIRECQ